MTDLETLATLIALPGYDPTTGEYSETAGTAQSKANVIAIADAAGLPATGFRTGDPAERMLEIMGRTMAAWGSVPQQASRGLILGLQTDPGDPGDLSADQTPRPGFLSALGVGWWGTERGGQTRATSRVTVKNNTSLPITSGPFKLTFEDSDPPRSDGGQATYRNTAGATTVAGAAWPVNVDGTITIAAGATAVLGVVADQLGTYGSTSAANKITVLTTTSYGVLTILGSTKATGSDREDRDSYIARCQTAADSNAPGGPGNAYRRAATTTKGGAPLQRYDGTGPVEITNVLVSPESADNEVTLIYSGAAGAVSDEDVLSANANILGIQLLDPVTGEDHNPDPSGVVPDTVTLLPGVGGDPGGYGGVSATNLAVAVTYTVHIRAGSVPGGATVGTYTSGGSPPAPIASLFATIAAALSAYLPSLGPGGRDQTGGAGVVYRADLADVIAGAAPGFYAPAVTLPITSTVAVDETEVPVAGTITGTIEVKP